MVKHKTYGGRFGHGGGSGTPATTTTPTKIQAPTLGLKEIFFSTGTVKDVADFLITKKKLSRCLGTQSYKGSATASRVLTK